MKRVLCITANMNAGGAETFLMKLYRNLDKEKYQMDFLVSITGKNFYEDEIKSYGGRMFYVIPKSKSPIKSLWGIRSIVKKNNYKYVLRVNEHSLATLDLLMAKLGGAKILAMRSSNANSGTKIKVFLHKTFSFLTSIIPNVRFAPSTEAAEYTFGKKLTQKGKVTILKNAVDYKKYKFDESARIRVRKELGLNDKHVIGHVGRFYPQKNHKFLIDVFNEIKKNVDNSVLVLVGGGALEKEIKKKVEALGLKEDVIFLGERNDIPDILMSMDFFVFPSFYEGMPNSVIEAQATGLKCLLSENITEEAKITGLVEYMSLNDGSNKWAKYVIDNLNYERRDMSEQYKKAGYNIQDVTENFQRLIFG